MEWNGSMKTFFSRPDNPSFLYNNIYCSYEQNAVGMEEMKHHPGVLEIPHLMAPAPAAAYMDKKVVDCMNNNNNYGNHHQERKKKLTTDQLDSLERCFQEEIKLHPERKMKLARELGLQPRQIAVWFQNRRARWKNKQLEHLYDDLKQEYDSVSRQKQKLQEEVIKLQEIIREQGLRKQQVSAMGLTELSGEETVESTEHDVGCSNGAGALLSSHRPVGRSNYFLNVVDNYNNNNNNNHPVPSNYLGVLPPYP